jgi:hypothetical protein
MKASAALSLINAGWKPDAIADFLANNDIRVLMNEHSGLFSVQLQPPGTSAVNGKTNGQVVAKPDNIPAN